MTDQSMENKSLPVGEAGDAPSQPSQEKAKTSSAVSSDLLVALEDIIDRKLQSGKDKRFAKLQGTVDDFEQRLVRLDDYIKKGWNREQALDMMRLEDSLPSKGVSDEPNKTVPASSAKVSVSVPSIDPGLLEKLGIDLKDSAVVDKLGDLSDARKVLEYVANNIINKPAPNLAQQTPTSSGQAASSDTAESITAQLYKAMESPSKNQALIETLNKRLGELLAGG